MIGKCTHDVQVARTDFVESRDAMCKDPFLVGYVDAEPLTHKDMGTDAGREIVVTLGVTGGFLGPELIAEYRVEIQSTFQGFERERLVQLFLPGNEVLLQGHGNLALIR